jgi:ASC-1-like (ASCH) protein
MKNWTVRFRKIDKDKFDDVKSGRKRVETRAATVKYAPIQEGDTIAFVCGTAKFKKTIVRKHHFKTVAGMIKKIPLKHIMPDVKTLAEAKARYATYPDYPAKIKEFGLFAFELV